MEIYTVHQEVKVFGKEVITFPTGVGEAFESLVKTISEGYNRAYYGISYFNNEGKIVYKAAAEETFAGEAEKYGYERYTIEKGEYLMVAVKDWRHQTDCIKDVFHEMMQDKRYNTTKPCIEWYKDDDEMLCMIQTT